MRSSPGLAAACKTFDLSTLEFQLLEASRQRGLRPPSSQSHPAALRRLLRMHLVHEGMCATDWWQITGAGMAILLAIQAMLQN